MKEWISVDDKLPEYQARACNSQFVHVLICGNHIPVSEGMYCNEKWETLGVDVTQYVTHWMPLPARPKKIDD